MAFLGLFIGIDRYASPAVNELRCAARDAIALQALFGDTLGNTTVLLTDAEATRAGIEAEFAKLAACDPDDTVVIAFSGHGSETHELVTYDTELADLPGTAIPLDLLQEWFSRIPAKRLAFFLDCCFSGGLGAKVLQVDARPRGALQSVDARLNALAGDGRIIFTASKADEPAWENGRYGHGLLTYFLMEALRGADEARDGDRISLYALLRHVTSRVQAAAQQLGQVQNPTVRGRIDGDIFWPIFQPAALYAAAFPARPAARASADLNSLAALGIPHEIITAWSGAIPSLNPLQQAAINDYGILEGQHLVVSAPTSSGKTMIGELAALRHILERRRAIFLLPMKALVADKRRQFQSIYGPFGLRTVEATGETDDISPVIRGRYDIALMTYEKFAAIALTFPHILAQVGVIVVDEVQMIADPSRGKNLEFLLTLIRMRRRHGVEPQVVALSAVIGDTNGLEQWFGARLLRRNERPVPLREGLLLEDGRFRFIDPLNGAEAVEGPLIQREARKGSSQDWVIPLVRRLVGEGQQVIVFREQKGEARGCANYLADALNLPAAADAVALLPLADPSIASNDLRGALARGVAFHHADLTPTERMIVEEEFRRPNSGIRVIAATTTLAMGVNTPANSVVIVGLQHPGPVPYSVAEYKNMVGRAGRQGFAAAGTSYLLALDGREANDFWRNYVGASPENVTSRFLDRTTDPRSLIVRVIAATPKGAAGHVGEEEVADFLQGSFGAFQAARQNPNWKWSEAQLRAAFQDLERHGLLERSAQGGILLTELGRVAGETATEVRSIINFVGSLRQLTADQITDPVLLATAQTSVELDEVHFPVNAKGFQKEAATWTGELRNQGLANATMQALGHGIEEPSQHAKRAKKAVSCLLYISGEPMEAVEATLARHGGGFGGLAGAVRGAANRTSDLLPTVGRVAQIIHPGLDLGERIGRLTLRLTFGIPGGVVDLARELGTELLRGEYIRLHRNNLCEPDAVDAAADSAILACIEGGPRSVARIRESVRQIRQRRDQLAAAVSPALQPYQS